MQTIKTKEQSLKLKVRESLHSGLSHCSEISFLIVISIVLKELMPRCYNFSVDCGPLPEVPMLLALFALTAVNPKAVSKQIWFANPARVSNKHQPA
jgi:hypothetical protein